MAFKFDPDEPRESRLRKEWYRYRHYKKEGWWYSYPKWGDFTEQEVIEMGEIIRKEMIKKKISEKEYADRLDSLIEKEY